MRWMRWSSGLMLAGALAGVAAVAGCTDSPGPVPLAPAPPPTPRTNQLPTLIASAPVPSLAPSAPIHILGQNAPPTSGVVYVSLPPGAVPGGLSASIRDVESGQVVAAAVVDGGFDPVAITATIGDTLLVTVQSVGSVGATLGYLTVAASTPPVVVRTSPPPKKVDVPLNAFMVAVFSGPLDASTVNATTVTLWHGTTPVPGTVRFADVTDLRVEFHPDTPLAGQTDYQLILGQGIHDVNGLALDSVVTVAFTTGITEATTGLVFASVSAGWQHTCGLTTNGTAYCWGDNTYGQLGDGSTASSTTPMLVAGGLSFANVSAGPWHHTCGVTTSGAAYCWGEMFGNTSSSPVPIGGGLTFASVTAGFPQSCGVTTTGTAYCWGDSYLGNGTTAGSTIPVPVAGGLLFAAVSAAEGHTCGVTTAGVAYCWGENTLGQLGTGTSAGPERCLTIYACSTIPVAVAGGLTFANVNAAGLHTCGVTTSGGLYCWGANFHGLLGDGVRPTGPEQCLSVDFGPDIFYGDSIPCSLVPRVVAGGLRLTSLSGGAEDWTACGLAPTGVAYCWGDGEDGESSTTPVAVAGGFNFATLSAWYSTCGITATGALYCWGANESGQLGNGTTTSSSAPVKVAGQP